MINRHTQRTTSRQSFPSAPPSSRLYRNIAFAFLGFTGFVVGIAVWMTMTHATVRVQVQRETTRLETSVGLAEQPTEGKLHARIVEGVFDKIQEFSVKEGATSSIVTTTTGRVRITNRYSKDQPLIKSTRLLTADDKLFRINRTVTVPLGGSVDVEVYSDGEGSEYLIAKGTKLTIPGLWIDLQPLIQAEALADFEGQASNRKAVTKQDIDEAKRSLEMIVLQQAKSSLAVEAGLSDQQLDDACTGTSCWMGVYVVDTIEEKANVKAGQETDAFLAQVKLNVQAVFYQRADMDAFVRAKLRDKMPEGRELVELDSQHIVYKLEEVNTALHEAQIRVDAEASSRLTGQSPLLLPEEVAGLGVEEAKQKLLNVPGTEFVEITLRPSWARRLPSQKGRIEVIIE
ncbi:MAG: hypothetical protein NUV81_01050 [bacterium]|nr:hypothetical protein [bacterium]